MERQVILRDYQEQQSADHNNIQAFARQSIDHIVDDVVTKANRYAGFVVTKSAQAEVTVAPGRFFQAGGAVFNRSGSHSQNMVQYLAAASKRIIAVSVYGQENETDVTERDFLVNVETGETEPNAVAMTRARDAVLAFTPGSESADPQNPPVASSNAVIAYVLVDTIQVVSVTMVEANRVASTENLDVRARSLEAFRAATEPRITSLAADLAALANLLALMGRSSDLAQIYQDLAHVKEMLGRPDDAADYGANHYLTTAESDVDNTALLGYDAKVEEGIRFADANQDISEIDVFSANDPNAALANGLLLPAYTDLLKMRIAPYHSDLGIAQYGFQTFDMRELTISRTRIRYGEPFTMCTNNAWFFSGRYDPVTNIFSRNGEQFEVLDGNLAINHTAVRLRQLWTDSYNETYWYAVVINHTITGAQVAQSFLVSNDYWLTKLGLFFTAKAANENVFLTICEVTNGVPDLQKAILHQTIPHAAMLENDWTRVSVKPTFLKAGKRYAVVLTSNANHRVGMASGQSFLEGTFFYSTDGAFFQGDLTKDLMLEFYGARFNSPQVSIELDPINLDGGIRAIDILAGMVRPESTDLVFEIKTPSGDWTALRPETLDALTGAPPLFQFRARFVGTRDMMPGLQITGSRVYVSRPKTAFKHVSVLRTLNGASNNIYRKVLLEEFLEVPHDYVAKIYVGTTELTATAVTEEVLPDLPNVKNRVQRTYRFQPATPTASFREIDIGSTNSPANVYHVSESVYWSTV